MREKFGIVMPNSVKEALLLYNANAHTKRRDLINKEMMDLEKLSAWNFYHPTHNMGNITQENYLE